jgi:tetratricopeptide (TPR) repeat protein
MRTSWRTLCVGAFITAGGVARGQTAAEHLTLGDRDVASLNVESALKHFEAAIALEANNYNALVKAAQAAIDLGEFHPSAEQRATFFRSAEQYARRAVAANALDADGHFELSQALGRNALSQGPRDRIKFAKEVREQAMEALKLDPQHSGALHVMGLWNAEVMRLNGFTRMIAKNFLGGQIFSEANWDNAQTYLERAVAGDSARISHRLDLGAIYADRKMKQKAAEQFEWIARAPSTYFNDVHYKEQAARRLAELK